MKGFDNRFLDELKAKSDIVEVVSKYMPLESRGGNFWGRCPFHHEKTPSFCVNPIDQFYYCFGCHKAGDVIRFVQEIESLDFFDAVKLLAENARMEIPSITAQDEKIKEQKAKKKPGIQEKKYQRSWKKMILKNLIQERSVLTRRQ